MSLGMCLMKTRSHFISMYGENIVLKLRCFMFAFLLLLLLLSSYSLSLIQYYRHLTEWGFTLTIISFALLTCSSFLNFFRTKSNSYKIKAGHSLSVKKLEIADLDVGVFGEKNNSALDRKISLDSIDTEASERDIADLSGFGNFEEKTWEDKFDKVCEIAYQTAFTAEMVITFGTYVFLVPFFLIMGLEIEGKHHHELPILTPAYLVYGCSVHVFPILFLVIENIFNDSKFKSSEIVYPAVIGTAFLISDIILTHYRQIPAYIILPWNDVGSVFLASSLIVIGYLSYSFGKYLAERKQKETIKSEINYASDTLLLHNRLE